MSEVKGILKQHGLLPNNEQELLLRACLLSNQDAVDAWQKWRVMEDIDLLDHSSNRLLPLLYYNLEKHGITDSIMNRYKGTYKKNWYKNQILFGELRLILNLLQKEGSDILMLKGAALLLNTYPTYGLRPMADLDVLVPSNQISKALKILKISGWKSTLQTSYILSEPSFFSRRKVDSEYFKVRASTGFRNSARKEFDLHNHAFIPSASSLYLDEVFWKRAVEIKLSGDLSVKVLSPTDALLHSLTHGLRRGNVVNLRWVADAHYILQRHTVDWDLLLDNAKRLQVTPFVKYGLIYLKELLDVNIASQALERISKTTLTASELEHFESENRANSKFANLRLFWTRNARIHSDRSAIFIPILFLKYLQRIYLLKHFWQVPLMVIYKAIRQK